MGRTAEKREGRKGKSERQGSEEGNWSQARTKWEAIGCSSSLFSLLPFSHPRIHLRLGKQPEQLAVQHPAFHFLRHDIERARERHGPFVWAVRGGERVEDVRDRHHARLNRDLRGAHVPRVAGAVELFVVSIGDLRNLLQLLGPRNREQEPERV